MSARSWSNFNLLTSASCQKVMTYGCSAQSNLNSFAVKVNLAQILMDMDASIVCLFASFRDCCYWDIYGTPALCNEGGKESAKCAPSVNMGTVSGLGSGREESSSSLQTLSSDCIVSVSTTLHTCHDSEENWHRSRSFRIQWRGLLTRANDDSAGIFNRTRGTRKSAKIHNTERVSASEMRKCCPTLVSCCSARRSQLMAAAYRSNAVA